MILCFCWFFFVQMLSLNLLCLENYFNPRFRFWAWLSDSFGFWIGPFMQQQQDTCQCQICKFRCHTTILFWFGWFIWMAHWRPIQFFTISGFPASGRYTSPFIAWFCCARKNYYYYTPKWTQSGLWNITGMNELFLMFAKSLKFKYYYNDHIFLLCQEPSFPWLRG